MAAVKTAAGARLREEAARWFLRLRGAPADDALRSRFEAWLLADAGHMHAYAEVAGAWDDFDSSQRLQSLADAARDTADATRRRRSALKRGAVALLVAGGAGGLAWRQGRNPPAEPVRVATGPGETREVVLADGSRIEMGPATILAHAYSAGRRSITLLAGTAAFDVTRDEERPFVVDAGALEVTVLGTYFAVDILPERTRVGVERGRIKVARPRRVFGWRMGDEAGWQVDAGQVLDVTADGASRPDIPAADVFSWHGQLLTFTDTPLTEVAQILSRYRVQPVVADPALARVRIAAVVRTADIEHFIRSLPRIASVSVVAGGAGAPTYLRKL